MNIQQLYQLFLKSSGVCTDTRKIEKGGLFFALKGDNFNGNTFAQQALDLGAIAVVIDDPTYFINKQTIVVENALLTLQRLANYHRKQFRFPIIALTGSNGKTTTKELIQAVLSKKYNSIATKGNLNNHIGVPLTLCSLKATTEIAIVEMGANHLKEIEALTQIIEPDYGYITNFGKAHLEGFGSEQGVIQGKSELYNYLKLKNKPIFINGADPKQVLLAPTQNAIIFNGNKPDYHIELLEHQPFLKVKFRNIVAQTQLVGIYNFSNVAAAITMGLYFKVSETAIKEAIESYIPAMNRSQLIHKNSHSIILDAYNANPTSMEAALLNFKEQNQSNKLCLLGDMFELGESAKKEHQNIIKLCDSLQLECYFIGSNFYKAKTNTKNSQFFENFETLAQHLQKFPIPQQSSLLIKGSRGMALERILNLL